jgi:hypothetical protein
VDLYHVTFGPTNLLIHAVSCALRLSEYREVIPVGQRIDMIDDRDMLAQRAACASTHPAAGRLVVGDRHGASTTTPSSKVAGKT